MPTSSGIKDIYKVSVGGLYDIAKISIGEEIVFSYSAGNIVTYVVDADVTYQEEVEEGESCLSPKTFTPALPGWEFTGWRMDTSASGNVLDSLAMGDDKITLYAVFRKKVTATSQLFAEILKNSGVESERIGNLLLIYYFSCYGA